MAMPEGQISTCKLLDKDVGFKCLAALLGIGDKRLRKAANRAPDLRHGKREYRSNPASLTVDGFLQTVYDAVAETLPDEFLGSLLIISLCQVIEVCPTGQSCEKETGYGRPRF